MWLVKYPLCNKRNCNNSIVCGCQICRWKQHDLFCVRSTMRDPLLKALNANFESFALVAGCAGAEQRQSSGEVCGHARLAPELVAADLAAAANGGQGDCAPIWLAQASGEGRPQEGRVNRRLDVERATAKHMCMVYADDMHHDKLGLEICCAAQ